jgi:hypothetical protein
MAGYGRIPSGNARRPGRGLTGALTYLPAGGRTGKAPTWPLPDPTSRELEHWRRLWRTPMAVMWERVAYPEAIAHYVRLSRRAEDRPTGTLLGELRQTEDRWGLNPVALMRLRWVITDDDLTEADDPAVLSIRDRLVNPRPPQRFMKEDPVQ